MRNQRKPPSRSISNAPELDPIDRRVVAALQADGRRAFSSIADEVEVSESVVRYRVQRMEKAGILQVVGIADPLKLGFDLMAMIGVRVQPGKIDAVTAALTRFPETSYVASVAGQYDVFVELVCRDTQHFQSLLGNGIHLIEGIVSTESFLILEIHKMAYGWGVGDFGVPLADAEEPSVRTGTSVASVKKTANGVKSVRSVKAVKAVKAVKSVGTGKPGKAQAAR